MTSSSETEEVASSEESEREEVVVYDEKLKPVNLNANKKRTKSQVKKTRGKT